MFKRVINLVRHCESEWHMEKRHAGVTDIKLSEVGLKQARALVNWAESSNIKRIISSDLTRAIDSATPLANAIQIKVELDSRFREVNFGKIEGLTATEIESRYPIERARFIARPADTQWTNGESGVLALKRAMPAIVDCFKGDEDGDLVIFTHGTIMRLIVCKVMGIELNEYRRKFPLVPNLGRFTLELSSNSLDQETIRGALLRFDSISYKSWT